MKCTELWAQGDHRWLAFADDPAKPDNVIDTNQLVVVGAQGCMLMDPGGVEVFPAMVAAVTQEVSVDHIRHLFLSHQDPDVSSALPLWRQVCPSDLTTHVSWMWTGFVSHFDRAATFDAIPDEGCEIEISPELRVRVLPAHYLHSPGNFSIYDPAAKILFSGDIGAALVPRDKRTSIFVEDFTGHIQYMEAFHRRWMGSPAARDKWVAMIRRLDVDILAPQHGLLFRGPDVGKFLDWLAELPLGSGLDSFDVAIAKLD
ncbi:flavoprotein [Paramagnetospirillum kuznetsovii]|uniref:Flavoprotein n=1 Tax=Paramagnetospirillum kuznetsovii TaxID=2053833 RepID=A0A364NZT2_9PROT|nr:MBL fold metallo-hydrolase [Paramagnetospirillum kuznetsovii]RAU22599.1 flavoprotein [Paramagnetospirillum kuznetsovii]